MVVCRRSVRGLIVLWPVVLHLAEAVATAAKAPRSHPPAQSRPVVQDEDLIAWIGRGTAASLASEDSWTTRSTNLSAIAATLGISSNAGIGPELVAARPLAKAEVFAQLPPAYTIPAQITRSQMPRQRWLRFVPDDGEGNTAGRMAAAIALELLRNSQRRSFQAPLLGHLPRKLPEAFRWLAHPSASILHGLWLEQYASDRDAAIAAAAAPGTSTSTARLARVLASSRAVVCAGGPVLLPTVSLMSHASRGSRARNVEIDHINCAHRALRDVAVGEPLRIDYGERRCTAWLAQYGFVPEDASNESEAVTLRLQQLLPDLTFRMLINQTSAAGGLDDNSRARARRVLEALQTESVRWCSTPIVIPFRRFGGILFTGRDDGQALFPARVLQACFRIAFVAQQWQQMVDREGPEDFEDFIFVFSAGERLPFQDAEAFAKRLGGDRLKHLSTELLAAAKKPAPSGAPALWWADVSRCAQRQAVLLNIWGIWLTSAVLPPEELQPGDDGRLHIWIIAGALATVFTTISTVTVAWSRS